MAKSFGDRIRTLRKAHGLTLDKLAEQAGLSKSYLWELENKDPPRPSAEKLAGIAKALQTTVDFLIGTDTEAESAADVAFFREYKRMTPDMKATLKQMAKLLDK